MLIWNIKAIYKPNRNVILSCGAPSVAKSEFPFSGFCMLPAFHFKWIPMKTISKFKFACSQVQGNSGRGKLFSEHSMLSITTTPFSSMSYDFEISKIHYKRSIRVEKTLTVFVLSRGKSFRPMCNNLMRRVKEN